MLKSTASVLVTLSLAAALAAPLAAQEWQGVEALGLTVEDAKGQPVAGAEVRLHYMLIDIAGRSADPDHRRRGRLVVAGLGRGIWRLDVTHPGNADATMMVRLGERKKPEVVGTPTRSADGVPMRVKFFKVKGAEAVPPTPPTPAPTPVPPPPAPPPKRTEPAPTPPPATAKPPMPAAPPAAKPAPKPTAPPAEPPPAAPPPVKPTPAIPPLRSATPPPPKPAPAPKRPRQPAPVEPATKPTPAMPPVKAARRHRHGGARTQAGTAAGRHRAASDASACTAAGRAPLQRRSSPWRSLPRPPGLPRSPRRPSPR